MESNVILKVLRENKWNRRKAAQVLNISYRALIYKIQEAGLSTKNSRKGQPRCGSPRWLILRRYRSNQRVIDENYGASSELRPPHPTRAQLGA